MLYILEIKQYSLLLYINKLLTVMAKSDNFAHHDGNK